MSSAAPAKCGKRRNGNHKNGANKKRHTNNNNGGMTANAVRKMLLADAYTGPQVVALHCSDADSEEDPFVAGQICDNSFHARVLISTHQWQQLMRQQQQRRRTTDWCLVKVSGYVTSTVNAAGGGSYPAFQPFLCLTALERVPNNGGSKKSWEALIRSKRTLNATHEKLPCGASAPFVHGHLEGLTTDDLMGESRVPTSGSNVQCEQDWDQNQTVVQDFLMHHKAMKNLQESNLMIHHSNSNSAEENGDTEMNENGNATANDNNNQQPHLQMYNSALKEFASAQMDRQKASLTSNAGRATASDATKVVEQYNSTLQQVLNDCQSPTPWLADLNVQTLHRQLCGNGLHDRAGQLRTKTVKAGRTVFCPPNTVRGHLEHSLLPTFRTLHERLSQLPTHGEERDKARQLATACLAYASAVFFGLVDLHPFADGNGRLARLLSQGALRAMGLPFCLNWFATPAQRRDYVLAILMTRRNLSLVYRGSATTTSPTQLIQQCLKATGLYFPLVALLMDRAAKAIPEFLQLQKDKQASAQELDEARAARRARERAASGNCLICFDDHPNIATLCCGKAVHLSCIAEWLSSNASCPNCRGNFPALPARPAARVYSSEEEDDDSLSTLEDDTTTYEDSDMTNSDMLDDTTSAFSLGDSTTEEVEGNEDEAVEIVVHPAPQPGPSDDTETVEVEDDDTTIVVVNPARAAAEEEVDQPAEEEEDDTLEESSDDELVIDRSRIRTMLYGPEAAEDDDTTDDTVVEEVVRSIRNRYRDDTTSDEDEGEDDDTTTVQQQNWDQGDDTASDENDDTGTADDTSDAVAAGSNNNHDGRPLLCDHCRNRAALDCTNACCGRCCLLHGEFQCSRHSNGI